MPDLYIDACTPVRQGGEGGGSPFDMFFGGGGGNKQGQRGRNMDIELPVTLEDLYVGNEKAATVKRRIVCRNCKGKAHLPRCSTCGSCPKEKKMVHRRAGPGMVVQQEASTHARMHACVDACSYI